MCYEDATYTIMFGIGLLCDLPNENQVQYVTYQDMISILLKDNVRP